MERECPSQMFLSSNSKELGDQCNLPFHIPFGYPLDLPFPDPVHHLEPLQGSPGCRQREKAHPWLCQSLDKTVILLDQVIEVFHLSQFHVLRQDSSGFEFRNGFGIGGILIHIDHTRSQSRGVEVNQVVPLFFD